MNRMRIYALGAVVVLPLAALPAAGFAGQYPGELSQPQKSTVMSPAQQVDCQLPANAKLDQCILESPIHHENKRIRTGNGT